MRCASNLQFNDLVTIVASLGYEFKSIQNVEGSFRVFLMTPMITVLLTSGY